MQIAWVKCVVGCLESSHRVACELDPIRAFAEAPRIAAKCDGPLFDLMSGVGIRSPPPL
jgi:hypothetical protein